jgi:hypothetical protein
VETIVGDANRELDHHHRVDMPQLLKGFELLELERLDLLEEKLKEYAILQLEMVTPLVTLNELFQKNVSNLNVGQQVLHDMHSHSALALILT